MPRARILTLNFFLRPPGVSDRTNKGGDWKEERIRLFASHFSSYDIVCFQETFGSLSSRRDLLVSLAKDAGLVHSAAGRVPSLWRLRVDAGLLVVSRWPIEGVEETTFGRGTEVGDWLAAKGVLYVRVRLPDDADAMEPASTTTTTTTRPNRRVHVFTSHFQSCDSSRALELRARQFVETKAFIDRVLHGDGDSGRRIKGEPVLLCGDLNVDAIRDMATSDGGEYARMMAVYAGHRNHGSSNSSNSSDARDGEDVAYVVEDVVRQGTGSFPVTTSRLRVGEGLQEPDRKCLDYILSLVPKDETTSESQDAPPPAAAAAAATGEPLTARPVSFENARVEKFLVEGQPFSSLSDHFAVAADFVW
ncbi:Sphingomyelin phosphodiesterase 2, neutral membrane (Neutral sphingomyelinase) [Thoreauomyces humboldtii]|nr:Sphingomyelin phosphodiesterase 2, neutral membrane (Neutral sphingomyelinase) [Thoreauomyces humboldtii]